MGWRWKPPLLSHRPAPAWMYEGGPRSSDWPRADRRGRETRGWSRSFPALLDVGLDELLGVLLQHGVDLVEDVVHLLLQGLTLAGGLDLAGIVAVSRPAVALLGLALFLLLRHTCSFPHPYEPNPHSTGEVRCHREGTALPRLSPLRSRSALEQADQRRSVGRFGEELLDVRPSPPEGFAHRHALERVVAGVEDQRIPRRRDDGVPEPVDAPPPEERPGVLGRFEHGPLDLVVIGEPLDLPGGREAVVQTLVPADVVVLQVDQPELRVVPRQPVALPVSLQDPVLRHPVQLAVQAEGVLLQCRQHGLPPLEDLYVRRGGFPLLDVLLGVVEELPLQLDGGQPAAVGQPDQGATRD